MEEKSLTMESANWLVLPPWKPGPKYTGTGGSTPSSVRYLSAQASAHPKATAHGR